MDFDDSPEEAAYRARAREWILANAPDYNALPVAERHFGEAAHLALAKQFQAKKARDGYTCIDWPQDWGGVGGTTIQQAIFNQEELKAGVHTPYYTTGLGMLIPALLRFSDKATTDRLVPEAVEKVIPQITAGTNEGAA